MLMHMVSSKKFIIKCGSEGVEEEEVVAAVEKELTY